MPPRRGEVFFRFQPINEGAKDLWNILVSDYDGRRILLLRKKTLKVMREKFDFTQKADEFTHK